MRSSEITHGAPSTGLLWYWIGRLWLALFGWDVEGELPPGVSKAVLIAAPHTSNWDLPHMLAAAFVFRVRVSWMGKHSLFRFPLGPLLRLLGGLPIDRRAPQGVVGQTTARFVEGGLRYLAIPPSGTRKKAASWKSGFYWIAHGAGVPVVCAYLDYPRRRAGVGFSFVPTGDVKSDMDRVRAFYADKRGKFPECETPITLKEEVGPVARP